MSDLILSLPHRHIMSYVVQITYMILSRMCLLWDLHFTLLYVVVSQHLYLISCLNAHNHNTCIHLPQNRLYSAKYGILNFLSRSPNTSTSRWCHGNHHNNQLKFMISVIIVTGKVFHCFCLKLSFGQYNYKTLFGDSSIITAKNKTKSYTLTWRIWTSCSQVPPTSFSSARLTWPIMNYGRQISLRRLQYFEVQHFQVLLNGIIQLFFYIFNSFKTCEFQELHKITHKLLIKSKTWVI